MGQVGAQEVGIGTEMRQINILNVHDQQQYTISRVNWLKVIDIQVVTLM